jgi:hypothetical protein
MASKRRLRRKRCTNKKRYPDRESAGLAVMVMKRKGKQLGLYGCGNCGGFHLGHLPQFVKDIIEEKQRNK